MDDTKGNPIEVEAEDLRWASWMDTLEANWRAKIEDARAEYRRGPGGARDSAGEPGGTRASREP